LLFVEEGILSTKKIADSFETSCRWLPRGSGYQNSMYFGT
jgi:hypothetical protein